MLQPCGDVDVVAEEVAAAFEHRASVDADADLDGQVALAVSGGDLGQGVQPALHSTVGLIEDDHVGVAEVLDDSPAVGLDDRFHDLIVLAQHLERGRLIFGHHAAVALDVGEHDGQMWVLNLGHSVVLRGIVWNQSKQRRLS